MGLLAAIVFFVGLGTAVIVYIVQREDPNVVFGTAQRATIVVVLVLLGLTLLGFFVSPQSGCKATGSYLGLFAKRQDVSSCAEAGRQMENWMMIAAGVVMGAGGVIFRFLKK
jgi:hypothetical protein